MTWWPELYDDLLADVLLEGTTDVDETVRFLVEQLRLTPRACVFDQCCGTGRLSIPLARWGAQVIGVEQAARYVERARAAAGDTDARFDVGDAFEYVPDRACHGAINWWTSFGYLPDDDANVRMLRRAFEALAPGGRFALDYPNVPNLYATFRPHDITRRGDITMLRESRLDLARGLLLKHWTFITDKQRSERDSTLRLYTPDRLAELFASVGFVELQLFGGVDGAPLSFDRPRCIIVGVRP
ncbi:MAG: class I SAM-dependent methyltransferase [Myxococcota bacterium]|nr:class I SAM-dependent methyltransferase [Deltaproteobacteria bacterium]MDQ3338087.1 class I SAM-dependent methyltransferase [Myxococcota bacterium]